MLTKLNQIRKMRKLGDLDVPINTTVVPLAGAQHQIDWDLLALEFICDSYTHPWYRSNTVEGE
jgi:hypothetical protein